MLRYHCQQGLPRWIFEELESIHEVAHRYSDEQSPEDLVETLAEELAPHFCTPPERLLDGTALFFEYDPSAIQVRRYQHCRVLSQMVLFVLYLTEFLRSFFTMAESFGFVLHTPKCTLGFVLFHIWPFLGL